MKKKKKRANIDPEFCRPIKIIFKEGEGESEKKKKWCRQKKPESVALNRWPVGKPTHTHTHMRGKFLQNIQNKHMIYKRFFFFVFLIEESGGFTICFFLNHFPRLHLCLLPSSRLPFFFSLYVYSVCVCVCVLTCAIDIPARPLDSLRSCF